MVSRLTPARQFVVPGGASISASTFVTAIAAARHFKEPQDTSRLVEVANLVNERFCGRPLNWLHLPVPIDRVDPGPITPPLPEPRAFLRQRNCISAWFHDRDGVPGTLKRIEVQASRYVKRFGGFDGMWGLGGS